MGGKSVGTSETLLRSKDESHSEVALNVGKHLRESNSHLRPGDTPHLGFDDDLLHAPLGDLRLKFLAVGLEKDQPPAIDGNLDRLSYDQSLSGITGISRVKNHAKFALMCGGCSHRR